jgi:hypothetical protein
MVDRDGLHPLMAHTPMIGSVRSLFPGSFSFFAHKEVVRNEAMVGRQAGPSELVAALPRG